jgi:hypothetical protein
VASSACIDHLHVIHQFYLIKSGQPVHSGQPCPCKLILCLRPCGLVILGRVLVPRALDCAACALQSLVHVLAAMAPCTRLYGFLGCQLARSQRVTGAQPPANPCQILEQAAHWQSLLLYADKPLAAACT